MRLHVRWSREERKETQLQGRKITAKMERWQAKMLALVGIFIIPFLCTVLPCKVSGYVASKGQKGKKILSCLMCFGGGVFFATYILHMGPEVRDILHHALLEPNNITYPLADLLMGAGFFLVFYIEKIVIKINKRRLKKKAQNRRQKCLQFNKQGQCEISVMKSQTQPLAQDERDCESGCQCECDCEQAIRSADLAANAMNHAKANGNGTATGQDMKPEMNGVAANACPLLGTGECCNDPIEVQLQNTDKDVVKMFGELESHHQPNTEEEYEDMEAHFTRSLVLLLALSLHRIFEGMSVGLQTSVSGMGNLFLAVMCHETVIGFSLGLQFVKNKMTTRRILLACFLCSLIMPLGVAIGTMIVELGNQGPTLDIVNGILQSIATGTFIYVTFFEILQEEISPHDTSLAKVTSVLIGFSIMAALSAVPEESNPAQSSVEKTLAAHLLNVTADPLINPTTVTL